MRNLDRESFLTLVNMAMSPNLFPGPVEKTLGSTRHLRTERHRPRHSKKKSKVRRKNRMARRSRKRNR